MRGFQRWLLSLVTLGAAVTLIHEFSGFLDACEKFEKWISETLGVPIPEDWGKFLIPIILVLLVGILIAVFHRLVVSPRRPRREETNAIADDRVRTAYLHHMKLEIENRLKASLHGASLLDLKMDERLHAVVPWNFQAEEPGKPQLIFQRAEDAYIHFRQRMLLFGPPGSGKTTTIEHIFLAMVDAALADPDAPIPLLEKLSHFQLLNFEKRGPELEEEPRTSRDRRRRAEGDNYARLIQDQFARLVGGLVVSGLTPEVVNRWISSGRTMFFLDGLDEVAESRRGLLVQCLNNTLLRRYPDIPTIVSSRIVEYQMLEHSDENKLRLNGSATLQPLQVDEIKQYLRTAQADALAQLIDGDPALRELAANPLTLSIMTLAYQGRGAADIPATLPLPERRRQLLDDFVNRMMQREVYRRSGEPWDPHSRQIRSTYYSRQFVNHYLGRLAIALSQRMETRFPRKHLSMFFASSVKTRHDGLGSTGRVADLLLLAIFATAIAVEWSQIAGIWSERVLGAVGYVGAVGGYFVGRIGDNTSSLSTQPNRLWRIAAVAGNAVLIVLGIGFLLLVPPMASEAIFLVTHDIRMAGLTATAAIVVVMWLAYLIEEEANGMRAVAIALPITGFVAFLSYGADFEYFGIGLTAIFASLLLASGYLSEEFYFELTPFQVWKKVFISICLGIFAALSVIAVHLIIYYFQFLSSLPKSILSQVAFAFWIGILLAGPGPTVATALVIIAVTLGIEWATLTSIAVIIGILIFAASKEIKSYILTSRRAYIREMNYPTIRTSQNNSTSSYWIFTAIKSSKNQCDWAILSLPILFVLKLRRIIPWNYRRLIRYSLDCLFLKPAENSYEFMHLLLRDHFAVVELAPALRSTSAIQRLRVTEQLAFQGDASIDSLRMLLEDPDPGIRVAASRSLASIPSTAVGPIMAEVLRQSPDPAVRAAALGAARGEREEGAFTLVSQALRDAAPEVRAAAWELLNGRLSLGGSDRTQLVGYAVSAIKSGNETIAVARGAAEWLAGTNEKTDFKVTPDDKMAIAAAESLLADANADKRQAGVIFLGKGEYFDGAELLIRGLNDRVAGVRAQVVRTLSRFPRTSSVPALINATRDPDRSTRRLAVEFLAELTALRFRPTSQERHDVEPVLRSALRDRSAEVRAAAISAGLWLETPDGVTILDRALRSFSRGIRQAAVKMIRKNFIHCAAETQRALVDGFADRIFRYLGHPSLCDEAAEAIAVMAPDGYLGTLSRYIELAWSPRQVGTLKVLAIVRDRATLPALQSFAARLNRFWERVIERIVAIAAVFGLTTGQRLRPCLEAIVAINPSAVTSLIEPLLSARSLAIRKIAVSFALYADDPTLRSKIEARMAEGRVRSALTAVAKDFRDPGTWGARRLLET